MTASESGATTSPATSATNSATTSATTSPDGIAEELANEIRIVFLDVDGVLTDGSVFIGTLPGGDPVELKRFDIQDGLGVKMLQWAGIEVAVVSGRVSEATRVRARELGISECHQDPDAEKLPLVRRMLEERGLEWSQAAHLADDLADLPVLRAVGLPASVANAVPEVRDASVWTGSRRGGSGAVREFCRALLEARGQWSRLVEEYCDARS